MPTKLETLRQAVILDSKLGEISWSINRTLRESFGQLDRESLALLPPEIIAAVEQIEAYAEKFSVESEQRAKIRDQSLIPALEETLGLTIDDEIELIYGDNPIRFKIRDARYHYFAREEPADVFVLIGPRWLKAGGWSKLEVYPYVTTATPFKKLKA